MQIGFNSLQRKTPLTMCRQWDADEYFSTNQCVNWIKSPPPPPKKRPKNIHDDADLFQMTGVLLDAVSTLARC